MTLNFKNEGDVIVLLGQSRNDIGSSEYLHKIKSVPYSSAPHFELEEEFNVQQLVTKLIQQGNILSAHDISEGGLIITLLESAFTNNKGFEVTSLNTSLRKDAYWLGEAQSRVVVSCAASQLGAIEILAASMKVPISVIGKVTASDIRVEGENWGNIADWKHQYDTAIESKMK